MRRIAAFLRRELAAIIWYGLMALAVGAYVYVGCQSLRKCGDPFGELGDGRCR